VWVLFGEGNEEFVEICASIGGGRPGVTVFKDEFSNLWDK